MDGFVRSQLGKERKDMERLWLYGMPGDVGGAATKLRDLVRLLGDRVRITVVVPDRAHERDPQVMKTLKRMPVSVCCLDDLPKSQGEVCLAVCEVRLFTSGHAQRIRDRGYRLIFSNEMMWAFSGEKEACEGGVVSKVLYVSEFQRQALGPVNGGLPHSMVGNYVDPERYTLKPRTHWPLRIGRVSRADPDKYPENFPGFYESICRFDVEFRVMGWDAACAKKFPWHRFDDRWVFLKAGAMPVWDFLGGVDLFVYGTDRKLRESWGRAVVEAMLTGCIPVLPSGHAFEEFLEDGVSGYICLDAGEYRMRIDRLYRDREHRERMMVEASRHAREEICNREKHARVWEAALFN